MPLAGTCAFDAETIYLSPAPMYYASPIGFTGTVLLRSTDALLHLPSGKSLCRRLIDAYTG